MSILLVSLGINFNMKNKFVHPAEYECISGKKYCLKHLYSRDFIYNDSIENKEYRCKIYYSDNVYTKGVKAHQLRSVYDEYKLINIEETRTFKEYRFFSSTRYNLSLSLNDLLDKCYNNEIRIYQESNNKYVAFPFIKSDTPKKHYGIYLSFKKSNDNNAILIHTAYIETDLNKINKRLKNRKIKFLTILRKFGI